MKHLLKITILLFAISLTSCDQSLKLTPDEYPFLVKNIYQFDNKDKLCQYDLDRGTGYVHYINQISIIDTIGKFDIGDTVRLQSYK